MNTLRYILGYVVGVTLFVFLIPAMVWAIAYACPHFQLSIPYISPLRFVLSGPIGFTGLYFIASSNVFLLTRGKGGPTEGFGIEVSPKTQKLVTTGVYKHTRNPMVFGAFCIYTSVTLYMLSPFALFCLFLFYCWVKHYLQKWEEPRLLKDFGEEYLEYKKRTAMIIPHFRCRKHESA
ncbi:MAG: isoprenylcysteine carboxylmethyltransferase family protein [Opitutales bacterium]|nr:isoprenylcysteine carboxylmethyltransferase family protein [Opitutales bacterium]